MKDQRTYISGPISGLSREEYLKRFKDAKDFLEKAGHKHIVSPVNTWACRWLWIYRIIGYKLMLLYDIFLLLTCREMVLLRDWEKSKGCQAEKSVADAVGIHVVSLYT